jgi:hypothetical protein
MIRAARIEMLRNCYRLSSEKRRNLRKIACVFFYKTTKQRWLLSVIFGTGVALTLALITLTWSFDMKLHLDGRAEVAVETPVK